MKAFISVRYLDGLLEHGHYKTSVHHVFACVHVPYRNVVVILYQKCVKNISVIVDKTVSNMR